MKRSFEGKNEEWTVVVEKTWADEEFKTELFANPIPILKEHGIEFPEGAAITIVEGEGPLPAWKFEEESNETAVIVVIPHQHTVSLSGELPEGDLEMVVGGQATPGFYGIYAILPK